MFFARRGRVTGALSSCPAQRILPRWQVAVTAVGLLLALGSLVGQAVPLAENGVAAGAIVAGPGAGGEKGAAAVADLRRCLGKMTGTEFPATGRPVVCVGAPADFPAVKLDRPLAKYEVGLEAMGGTYYLLGVTDQSVSDAVYTFLDRLGCRWYMPGDIGEVIPDRPAVDPGDLHARETPAFAMRQPWYAGMPNQSTLSAWYRRNRFGGDSLFLSHNLLGPIPPAKYFKDHPEYYALVNGVRQPTQPCTSNPALVPIYAKAICEYFREHPTAISYSMTIEDNPHFCECPRCRALDSGRIDHETEDRPVVTDRIVAFINQVANEVHKEYPDKLFVFLGYINHTLPPVKVRLAPGLAVVLTTQEFCRLHGTADPSCPSRRRMIDIVKEYARQTPHVYIYDYDPPNSPGLPYPLYLEHARELRLYKRLGIQGFSLELQRAWGSSFPNLWFWAQGMWNPEFDENAALAQLCRDFYGPAAAPMLRYYRQLAATVTSTRLHSRFGLDTYAELWSEQELAPLAADLRQAEAATLGANPQVRERVRYVRLEYGILSSYLQFAWQGKAGNYSAAVAGGERLLRLLDDQRHLNEDMVYYPDVIADPTKELLRLKQTWPQTADFARENDLVARLPRRWAFRADPQDVGLTEGWARCEQKAGWSTIATDREWEQQKGHESLTGVGWARTTFTLPARYAKRPVRLFVGALDDTGEIYLNGREVWQRGPSDSPYTWLEPFSVDITAAVRPGRNVLTVRAEADSGLGGLWRGAVVYSPKGPVK